MVFLLYLPHLHWQFVNDFPSIRYHLFERFSENNSYNVQNTLLHLINQIALFGFTFPLVYLAFFKNLKSKGSFEKSLTFIVAGFISCFFFASFIGHVQLQWTLVIIIPLIIITFNFLSKNQKYIKLFNRLAFINILFIIAIRFLLANEGIIPIKLECHGNKAWAVALKEVTKDREIIFLNSYTNPALFTFYTEKKASSHNSINVRKSQYNILKIDDQFENKDILVERSLNSQKEKPYLSFVKGYKKSFHFKHLV